MAAGPTVIVHHPEAAAAGEGAQAPLQPTLAEGERGAPQATPWAAGRQAEDGGGTITGVTVGLGLTGGGTTGTVIIDIARPGVTTSMLTDGVVTAAKLGTAAATTDKIANLAVNTAKLANASVTTAKLADSAVTFQKLAADAVTQNHIVAGAVTEPKIANSALTQTRIADGAVIGTKIAAAAVTGAHVAPQTLTAANINPLGGVYSSKQAVYVVKVVGNDSPNACHILEAFCGSPNDLPLHGTCSAMAYSGFTVIDEAMVNWDSTAAAAAYRCFMCRNDSGGIKEMEVSIACIAVP